MRIALIDNGIDKRLVDYEEEIDFSRRDMKQSVRDEKYNHGTVCAGIIAKYAPGSNIISLKAIETVSDRCSVQYIRRAILYCPFVNDVRPIERSDRGSLKPRRDMGMLLLRRRYLFIWICKSSRE